MSEETVDVEIAAFDELKSLSASSFTKAKVEERKKLIERQEKLEKELEAAFAETFHVL